MLVHFSYDILSSALWWLVESTPVVTRTDFISARGRIGMLQSRAFRTETTSESRKSLLFFFFVFSFVVRFCPPLRTFEHSHKVACTRRTDNSSRVFCPRCRPLYYPPPVQLYSSRSSGIFHFYILLFFFLTFVYPFCLLWTLCWLGCSLFFFGFVVALVLCVKPAPEQQRLDDAIGFLRDHAEVRTADF